MALALSSLSTESSNEPEMAVVNGNETNPSSSEYGKANVNDVESSNL